MLRGSVRIARRVPKLRKVCWRPSYVTLIHYAFAHARVFHATRLVRVPRNCRAHAVDVQPRHLDGSAWCRRWRGRRWRWPRRRRRRRLWCWRGTVDNHKVSFRAHVEMIVRAFHVAHGLTQSEHRRGASRMSGCVATLCSAGLNSSGGDSTDVVAADSVVVAENGAAIGTPRSSSSSSSSSACRRRRRRPDALVPPRIDGCFPNICARRCIDIMRAPCETTERNTSAHDAALVGMPNNLETGVLWTDEQRCSDVVDPASQHNRWRRGLRTASAVRRTAHL